MKKKITYTIIMAALIVTAFFIGRNTVLEPKTSTLINNALKNIEYFEVTDTGLNLYDYNGTLYQW